MLKDPTNSPSSPVKILPHDAETIRWLIEMLSRGELAAGDPAEGAIVVELSTAAAHDGLDEGSEVSPKLMRAEVPEGPEGACSSVGIHGHGDEEERKCVTRSGKKIFGLSRWRR